MTRPTCFVTVCCCCYCYRFCVSCPRSGAGNRTKSLDHHKSSYMIPVRRRKGAMIALSLCQRAHKAPRFLHFILNLSRVTRRPTCLEGEIADVETKQIWHHQLGATWIFPLARRRVAQRSKVDPEIRCPGILPGVYTLRVFAGAGGC